MTIPQNLLGFSDLPPRLQILLPDSDMSEPNSLEPTSEVTCIREVGRQLELRRPNPNLRMSYKIDSLSFFVGSKDGGKDPVEFVVDVEAQIPMVNMEPLPRQSKPCEFSSELTYKRKDLKANVRSNWAELKSQFLVECKLTIRQDRDPNRLFNTVHKLKQNGSNIAVYVEEAQKMYKACSANLQPLLPNQFIAGLDNKSKIDIVHLYLNGKNPITFHEAKDAVIKFQ